MLKLAFLPYFTMFPVKKKPNPPPGEDLGCKVAGLLVQRFLELSKWWTKIHTRLTRSASGEEVIQQFYWLITFFGFN